VPRSQPHFESNELSGVPMFSRQSIRTTERLPAPGWLDTHAHFWARDLVRSGWNPPPPLDDTYAPGDWSLEIGAGGSVGCIFVETGSRAPELELLGRWSDEHPAVLGFIAPIRTDASDLDDVLHRWQERASFRGVRAHFENATADLLGTPALAGRLRLLALSQPQCLYEFLVISEQLRDVQRLCRAAPDLRVVIEHMGKPRMSAPVDPDWRLAMAALAADTTAVVKLSLSPRPDEFSELARRRPAGFPVDHVRRHVDVLINEFGPDRLVWGSDWPVSLLTASTPTLLAGWSDVLGPIGGRLTETARRVYRLPEGPPPSLR
jgi:L-fuconolactonase